MQCNAMDHRNFVTSKYDHIEVIFGMVFNKRIPPIVQFSKVTQYARPTRGVAA